jgi:hypothetical protein
MNNTADIDPALYACYYSLDTTEPFSIWTQTPNGDVEYTNYDLFTANSKTIIAFKHFSMSKTEYNYIIKFAGDQQVLQWACYEHLYEHVNATATTTDGVYTIMNSVSVPDLMKSNHDPLLPYEDRCDTDTYGVVAYKLQDGISPEHIDSNAFNGQTIKLTFPMFNSLGAAHIVFFKVKDVGTSYRDWPVVTAISKTLVGCLKLVTEWSSLAQEPFNATEEIAVDCNNLVKDLDIDEAIINELQNQQSDMPIYRFLKNADDARHDLDETLTCGPLFLNWVKSNVRYKSLNALVANVSNPPVIASSVLQAEHDQIESNIFVHCIKNNIDLSRVTIDYLIDTISDPIKLSDKTNRETRESLYSYRAYN